MRNVVSLEFNELNFDFIRRYCRDGKLPTFNRLLTEFQLFETTAEKAHPHLEPWIQWPTVYTGKTFAEHGLFRLGDVCESSHDQVWEALERQGITVGAVSPMNAANRCVAPSFFIPDPWTTTAVSGDRSLEKLYALVRDAVNRNSHEDRSLAVIGISLLPYIARYALPSSTREYARILRRAVKYSWARAIFLDRFLADVFLRLRARHQTRFASLFLNAGAHIQHHHMFDSSVYDGGNANPDWYSDAKKKGIDPLLSVYETYDGILADVLALQDTRVLVTTGLSQYPNPRYIYQYRFKTHSETLQRLGLKALEVVPRMSRDFLLRFATTEAATTAARQLQQVTISGSPMFGVEDRGTSLFCQLAYYGPAAGFATVTSEGRSFDLSGDVALVSIENGLHRTTGFHVDTDVRSGSAESTTIPLTDIFPKMLSAFGKTQASSGERTGTFA